MSNVYSTATQSVSHPCAAVPVEGDAQSGSEYATYASPDLVPIFPPPAAMTTNCLPPASYVAGVA